MQSQCGADSAHDDQDHSARPVPVEAELVRADKRVHDVALTSRVGIDALARMPGVARPHIHLRWEQHTLETGSAGGRVARVVAVHGIALDPDGDLVHPLLKGGGLRLLPLAEEHRDRDCGEDADDDDHDQQFDEGEAVFSSPAIHLCLLSAAPRPTHNEPAATWATAGPRSDLRGGSPAGSTSPVGFAPHPRGWFALCASTLDYAHLSIRETAGKSLRRTGEESTGNG